MAGRRAGQAIERPKGSGKWLLRIYLGRGPTGAPQYLNKTVAAANKREAEKALRALLQQHEEGTLAKPDRTTLNAYLDRWLEVAAKPRLRASTFENYACILKARVRPVLGGRELGKLTALDVQELYADLGKRMGPRSIRYTHAVLHSALKQAVKWKLIRVNPADNADLPRQVHAEQASLTPDQAERLFATVAEPWAKPIILLALTGALRPSEYLALKWTDLRDGSVSVQRTIEWTRNPAGKGKPAVWRFEDVKKRKSRRTVMLPMTAVEAIRAHRKRQMEEQLKAGQSWQDHGLMFCNEVGLPIHRRRVDRAFKAMLAAAGVPKVRLYDLRHTGATLALAGGVPTKVVSERLGHADEGFTLSTYAHVLPGQQAEAAERLESILFGK